MTAPNDFLDWYDEFMDDLVQDYNDTFGTDWTQPEVEEPDLKRWENFVGDEYEVYCEAWEERIQETLEDEAYHARKDYEAERFGDLAREA